MKSRYSLLGLNVTEVAHDIQAQVSNYVVKSGFVNSYDTWHGMYILSLYILNVQLTYFYYFRNKECGQGAEEDHRRASEG